MPSLDVCSTTMFWLLKSSGSSPAIRSCCCCCSCGGSVVLLFTCWAVGNEDSELRRVEWLAFFVDDESEDADAKTITAGVVGAALTLLTNEFTESLGNKLVLLFLWLVVDDDTVDSDLVTGGWLWLLPLLSNVCCCCCCCWWWTGVGLFELAARVFGLSVLFRVDDTEELRMNCWKFLLLMLEPFKNLIPIIF